MLRRKKLAFTLIELLVVVSIISILAGVILVSLSATRKKSKDARRKADLNQISLTLEEYYDDQSPNGYVVAATEVDVNGVDDALTLALTPNYINDLPVDPLAPNQYYHYQSLNSALDYRLEAILENANDPQGQADGSTWIFLLTNN